MAAFLRSPAALFENFAEITFDFATPILSTADAGSDVYICYNFWKTAQEEGEKPVFFTIAFCLLFLSSLCGVVFFLVQNWSAKDALDEEAAIEDDEAAGRKWTAGCFDRMQLSKHIGALVQRCGCNGESELAMKVLITSLLIVVLLPVGQLLPVLLWLQAKKEIENEELVPPTYPRETEPRLRRLAFGDRYTSMEIREYQLKRLRWYYTEFLPYMDASNKHFDRQLQRKIVTHLPFVVETGVEAIPQALLQTSAITIFSQRDPHVITAVNFVSIVLSLASIFSKAYIVCGSLVQDMFVCKMLLLCCDISSLFYAVSALWSLRREDTGGVHVFFLTRPVDIASAIYVWCIFLFVCALLPFMLLRFLGEWLFIDVELRYRGGEFYEGSIPSLTRRAYMACRSQFLPDGPRYDDEHAKKEKRFTMLAMIVIFFTTLATFCMIVVPVVIFAQACKLFWISVWLKDLEEQIEKFGWTAPYLLTVDEVVNLGDCFDRKIPFMDYECNALIADERLSFSFEEIVTDTGDKIRDTAKFKKLQASDDNRIFRLSNATKGCRARGSCLRTADVSPEMLSDMGLVAEPGKASVDEKASPSLIWLEIGFPLSMLTTHISSAMKPIEDANKTFFVQAYTWVTESSDFNMRVCAVNHALLTQHHRQVVPEPLQPKDLRLGICFFWFELLRNMPKAIRRLTIPNVFHRDCGELFEMFQSYDNNIYVSLNSPYWGEDGIASKTWHSGKMIPVILALGFVIQRALFAIIIFMAVYMSVFPVLSFALALFAAVSRNNCSETAAAWDQLHDIMETSLTWKAVSSKFLAILQTLGPAVRSLYEEDCYSREATPLNLFRTALIIVHLLLLFVLFAYWLWKARRLLSFLVAMEKANLEGEPDRLMKRVRDLYAKHYRVQSSSCSCCGGSSTQDDDTYEQLARDEQDAQEADEAPENQDENDGDEDSD